jgi:hypothetical protein
MIAYSRAMGESWGIMECKDGSLVGAFVLDMVLWQIEKER